MEKRLVLTAMFSMVLAFGLVLIGCDNGSTGGGGDGGLSVTIKNQYANPITKVGFTASNCTINDLTASSEETSGPNVSRHYEYTSTIAPGSSKTFSFTPDANETRKQVSVEINADGINWWESIVPGVFGDSYNRHFTVILYPDGEVDGEFEK